VFVCDGGGGTTENTESTEIFFMPGSAKKISPAVEAGKGSSEKDRCEDRI
jgi:hypothetical protein